MKVTGRSILSFPMTVIFMLGIICSVHAQEALPGSPIVRNFLPSDYDGHTQNFDIAEDGLGNIYVANFAGILVYNGANWDLLLTPDISRVTSLEADSSGSIYAGGLNEIGKIVSNQEGKLTYLDLKPLIPQEFRGRFGEVKDILLYDQNMFFFTRELVMIYDGESIDVKRLNNKISQVFNLGSRALLHSEDEGYFTFNLVNGQEKEFEQLQEKEITAVLSWDDKNYLVGSVQGLKLLGPEGLLDFETNLNVELGEARINDLYKVNENTIAIGTLRNGVFFMNREGGELTHVNRIHGLQNDYVNKLYRDKANRLWAALNNGISLIGYPWPWTIYNRNNGLKSGVVSITKQQGKLLAGTYQGLYQLNESQREFIPIKGIETACWEFLGHDDKLYGATSEGVFRIDSNQVVQLTNEFSLCISKSSQNPNKIYSGTLDGFNEIEIDAQGNLIQSITKHPELGEVTKLISDSKSYLWISTMNGQLARYNEANGSLEILDSAQNLPDLLGNQFYSFENQIVVGTTTGLMKYNYQSGQFESFVIQTDSTNGSTEWPGLLFSENVRSVWLTKGDETGLSNYIKKDEKWKYDAEVSGPFQDFICRSIYQDEQNINWFGGPFGLIRFDRGLASAIKRNPTVKISQIQFNQDSIFYGGFGTQAQPEKGKLNIDYDQRNITFNFSSSGYNVQSDVEYSYRLEGLEKKWSEWTTNTSEEYQKLSPGNYTFLVRAKDVYGRQTESVSFAFEIHYPWYQKWYMFILYALFAGVLIYQIVQLRLKNLVKEKQKLEDTVRDRTSEIREQRDEIQLKSEELSHALSDLKNTQNELIRTEKMASVGQMTKGIVDRMINPLNYINNFSSLSKDLANELKEVLETEKESISEDGYDEILDISSMLELNLGKIQEHGGSTVRIVKGMEELLRDRSGKFAEVDISELVTSITNNINSAYKDEFKKYGIELSISSKGDDFSTNVVSQELTKAIHELFDNASQSVISTCAKNGSLGARVIGEIESLNGEIILNVRDNGMGIPDKEKSKIFDPFFTTKPTAKGSGVGLYLVREIILSHKGSISVESEVNKETTFTMRLPIIKEVKQSN